MVPPVLVAAEVRTLIDASQLAGLDVTWVGREAPLPPGPFRGLVTLLTRRIGEAELDRLPALAVVANVAVGYDNIDLAATRQRGVVVTNTPDVLTDATADLTWALMLAAARGVPEAERVLRAGRWQGWHPAEFLGMELAGRTLGIVGAGRIGQGVGRRAPGFGMRVVYTARAGKPAFEADTGAQRVELETLLATSDVVSLHLAATPATRGVMDARRFAVMRPGAVFVNTARGDLVDEGALAAALHGGRLRAAGLDVFADEPRVSRALLEAPRLVLTPHIGSATESARRRMAACAVENLRAVLAGRPPPNPIVR